MRHNFFIKKLKLKKNMCSCKGNSKDDFNKKITIKGEPKYKTIVIDKEVKKLTNKLVTKNLEYVN